MVRENSEIISGNWGLKLTEEASMQYQALDKGRKICSICLKKENRIFTQDEEDRMWLLLRTYSAESYLIV